MNYNSTHTHAHFLNAIRYNILEGLLYLNTLLITTYIFMNSDTSLSMTYYDVKTKTKGYSKIVLTGTEEHYIHSIILYF